MCTSLTTFSLNKLAGEIEQERTQMLTSFYTAKNHQKMEDDTDFLRELDDNREFMAGAAAVLRYLANPLDNPFDIKEGRSIFTDHGYEVKFPS